jgi:Tfp pilus assembly protein PilV
MRHDQGITIVEILITVVVLAVGALGALGMQISSLRASSTAESIQILTRVGESELAFRRGIDKAGSGLANAAQCRVFVPDGFACAVETTPCSFTAAGPNCGAGVAAADAVAYRVTITTTSARGQNVALTSLVASVGAAAAGNGGDGGGGGGDDGDDDDDGGGAVVTPPPDPDPPVACVPLGNSGKCKK